MVPVGAAAKLVSLLHQQHAHPHRGHQRRHFFFWDTSAIFTPPLKPGTNTTTREWGESYNWTSSDKQKSRIWPSNGTMTVHSEVIVAHKGWVFALAAASAVLMATSLAPTFIRCFLTHGPKLAMNISRLPMRDKHHALLPENGTFLDAADRAKLVEDVKVQFGDVGGDDRIGRLAISSCGDRGRGVSGVLRVSKGRLYM